MLMSCWFESSSCGEEGLNDWLWQNREKLIGHFALFYPWKSVCAKVYIFPVVLRFNIFFNCSLLYLKKLNRENIKCFFEMFLKYKITITILQEYYLPSYHFTSFSSIVSTTSALIACNTRGDKALTPVLTIMLKARIVTQNNGVIRWDVAVLPSKCIPHISLNTHICIAYNAFLQRFQNYYKVFL